MNRKKWAFMGAVLCCVALVASGCQSVGRGAGLGSVIGGTAGAIIGHQSGHGWEGAAIGALAGAATGAIASDIRIRRAKSRQETAATYNYTPSQGEVLKFEETSVLPSQVKAGNMVEASIQYALLGSGESGTSLTEARTIKKGGEVIAEIGTKNFTRTDGTWVSATQFKVPGNFEPGDYSMVQVIQTAQGSRILGTAKFTVIP